MANTDTKIAKPLNGFLALFRSNPIILKEFRGRMRTWRGIFNLAIYTGVLSLAVIFILTTNATRYYGYNYVYGSNISSFQNVGSTPVVASIPGNYTQYEQTQLGSQMLLALVIIQLIMIIFLAPSFTAGTVASEKERQTYDILLTTLLRPRDIVLGKLFSTLAYLCLMVIASLPVFGAVFLVGGVSLSQVFIGLGLCLVTAFMLGALSIYRSAASRTTGRAYRSSLLILVILFLGIPGIGYLIDYLMRENYYSLTYRTVTSVNSTYAPYIPSDWVQSITHFTYSLNPVYALVTTSNYLNNNTRNLFVFSNNYYNGSGVRVSGVSLPMPWLTYLVMAVAFTVFFIWLAIKRIKPLNPEPRKRIIKRKKVTTES